MERGRHPIAARHGWIVYVALRIAAFGHLRTIAGGLVSRGTPIHVKRRPDPPCRPAILNSTS